MSEYVRFTPVITTTAALIGGLVFTLDEIPNLQYANIPISYEIQASEDFGSAITQYRVRDEREKAFQKMETIYKFASNLLENIEDLDPEFTKAIDENYWDLI